MTDHDKASVETIRGALRAYCPDDAVRVAVLKALVRSMRLADEQAPHRRRCWAVTFQRDGNVIRLNLSKNNALTLRTLDLYKHPKLHEAMVQYLIQLDTRQLPSLQADLRPYDGVVRETDEGRDHLKIASLAPCVVDLPATQVATGEALKYFLNKHDCIFFHDPYARYAMNEKKNDTWRAHEPNIIAYLRKN